MIKSKLKKLAKNTQKVANATSYEELVKTIHDLELKKMESKFMWTAWDTINEMKENWKELDINTEYERDDKSIIAKLVYLYRDRSDTINLYKLLGYINYPKPWPTVEDIVNITYIGGKLNILIGDSDKPNDFSDKMDSGDVPGHRVQLPGHQESSTYPINPGQ